MSHRLVSLVHEVEEAAAASRSQHGPLMWEEGYSAPLYARIYMRLGMWKWTITSSEVSVLPCELSMLLCRERKMAVKALLISVQALVAGCRTRLSHPRAHALASYSVT